MMMAAVAYAIPMQTPDARRPLRVMAAAGSSTLPRVPMRLLVQIRLGDEQAAHTFVTDWQPVIDAEARRYGRRGGPVEDLSAEGALAAWEAALRYDPGKHRTSAAAYIHNQVHRRVQRAYRKSMGFDQPREVGMEQVAAQPVVAEGFGSAEQRADLQTAITGLREGEQSQLKEYLGLALAGMGPDDAARALSARRGESFAAAKKRMQRLRRKVRELLQ